MKLYSLFIFTQRFLQRVQGHDATVPYEATGSWDKLVNEPIRVWYNMRLLLIIFFILRVYKVTDN